MNDLGKSGLVINTIIKRQKKEKKDKYFFHIAPF